MRSADPHPRVRILAVILALAVSTVAVLGVVAGPSLARSRHAGPSLARHRRAGPPALEVLGAANVARIDFGAPPPKVIRGLTFLLGRRPLQHYRLTGACGVDRAIAWPGLVAFFRQSHFVGYSYRPANGAGPHLPTLATARGLRVGDTLGRAKRLYGRAFHASNLAGGSWWTTTPRGRLNGLASGWPGGSRGSVTTIAAGRMGCPVAPA